MDFLFPALTPQYLFRVSEGKPCQENNSVLLLSLISTEIISSIRVISPRQRYQWIVFMAIHN